MYIDIIKGIVLSFVLILIIHNLYLFFQKTLTIPKTKDLVNKPSAKYAEILKTLTNMDVEVENSGTTSISDLNTSSLGNLLPENLDTNTQIPNQLSQIPTTNSNTANMKSELRDFLTSLGKNTGTGSGSDTNTKQLNAYETSSFSTY